MRIRNLTLACLVVLLVIPAFTAAWAQYPAPNEQQVEVQILPADVLYVGVEQYVGLGTIAPGWSSLDQQFGMWVTNTFANQGWQVTVDGNDLAQYTDWWCDDYGCYPVPNDVVLSKTHLFLRGGMNEWYGPTPAQSYEGYLSTTGPLLLTTASGEARGSFGFDYPPTVRLDSPADAATGGYFTILTYTISGVPTS